ncbi:MAG TPA: hypothetical protein VJQ06_07885 [Rhizomicrobium sp.]|nr:hypothetical protein [Rhizomicrobium sp.]
MRKILVLPVLLLALGLPAAQAAVQASPVDEAAAAKERAALCAKVTCRKASRPLSLRMPDKSNFVISTRPLPYFDDKGTLILFAGESVTLSYATDDERLEHPVLSSVSDPLGPVELPPPASKAAIRFDLQQMEGEAGMMLTVTNTTKTTVKYDAVMFMPDPAGGGARGGRTTACPVMPPQDRAASFSGFENWPQPIVMLLISNIRALAKDAPSICN